MEKCLPGFVFCLSGGAMADLIALFVCSCICWRIVFYRRSGRRYRAGVSMLAYLIALGTGGYALSIALSGPVGQTNPFVLVVLVVLCVMVFKARGNVASVIRVNWGD